MNGLFEKFIQLFSGELRDQEEAETYIQEFSLVALLEIIDASLDRIDASEQQQVQDNLEKGDLQAVLSLAREKYTQEEWENLLDVIIPPLLSSYIEEVVN